MKIYPQLFSATFINFIKSAPLLKTKTISTNLKNRSITYNAGIVVANFEVVGWAPGADPTKHSFSNFTHIFVRFSHKYVYFLHICELPILPNVCKYLLVSFSLQVTFKTIEIKMKIKNLSCQKILVKSY
jgi:hypothetical protein